MPEYNGGVSSQEPPVLEVPEFEGGVPSERPTILEVPEFRGSVLANTVEPIPNPKGQLQNLYRSSNKKLNLPVSIAFYKNYFLMKTERSSMVVYYDELKNIVDMEMLYLLDIGGNALIPVDKDSCSESCRDFLEAVRKNLLLGRR